jgi:catechol 2,3-dioxygenase-like lactoylglutathione lyase family enzyme
MHDFENLRKQAKLYLRWHRDGYHPVAAQIRAVLPRFRHLDDREVMSCRFKLGDAQEMVARQSGFESWQALRTGAKAMTDSAIRTVARPVVSQVEAQLFVADIPAACVFFTEKLGFEVVFTYGEPPFYGQVGRDAARINLRLVREPVFVGDIREREHLLGASMTLGTSAAIKRLYLEFQAAGVDFHQTLKSEPWGARTFVVRDPDGNLLLFAGPARA